MSRVRQRDMPTPEQFMTKGAAEDWGKLKPLTVVSVTLIRKYDGYQGPYLGIYLGRYDVKKHILADSENMGTLELKEHPVIFVLALQASVYGLDCWWTADQRVVEELHPDWKDHVNHHVKVQKQQEDTKADHPEHLHEHIISFEISYDDEEEEDDECLCDEDHDSADGRYTRWSGRNRGDCL